jgi:hypothetical protein
MWRITVADEQLIKLLEEIRDLQKAHVASYKEAVKNQQEAITVQKGSIRRQKITQLVIVVVVIAAVLLIASSSHH